MKEEYVILHAETISELEQWVEGYLNDDSGWYSVGGPFVKGQLVCQALQRQVQDDE